MEITGIDLSLIPTGKLVMSATILVFASFIASVPLISNNPSVNFIKRALLLLSLLGIIYLNIHGYSSFPYIFLLTEIIVLAACYKLYVNLLARLANTRDDIDVASRYFEDIKRKRELR
jgi:hypothetical protein